MQSIQNTMPTTSIAYAYFCFAQKIDFQYLHFFVNIANSVSLTNADILLKNQHIHSLRTHRNRSFVFTFANHSNCAIPKWNRVCARAHNTHWLQRKCKQAARRRKTKTKTNKVANIQWKRKNDVWLEKKMKKTWTHKHKHKLANWHENLLNFHVNDWTTEHMFHFSKNHKKINNSKSNHFEAID